MKKAYAAVALAICLLVTALPVRAEGLPVAAPWDGRGQIETAGDLTVGENGEWVFISARTAAASRLFSAECGSRSSLLHMYIELDGDDATGLLLPVLVIDYAHTSTRTAAEAILLAYDGTRCDFLAAAAQTELKNTERMRILLDPAGLAALTDMLAAERVGLVLSGINAHEFSLETGDSMQGRMNEATLAGLRETLQLLDSLMGGDAYSLWDLNAARWAAQTGLRKEMTSSRIQPTFDEIDFDKDNGLLLVGENSASVRALRRLLADRGFMYEKVSSSYDAQTRAAVLAAQKYYGMTETGAADAALAACLTDDAARVRPMQQKTPQSGELQLTRCWFARTVSPQEAADPRLAGIVVYDSGNVLFVADGTMCNQTEGEISLTRDAAATVVLKDGYSYTADIQVESGDKQQWSTALLPGATARVCITAEMPETLAGTALSGQVTVTLGSESISFDF